MDDHRTDLTPEQVQWGRKVKLAVGLWIAVPLCLVPGLLQILYMNFRRYEGTAPGDGLPIVFSVASFGLVLLLAITCTVSCLINFSRMRRTRKSASPR